MSQLSLSPRALRRLRIAASLMRVPFADEPTATGCQHLLRRIDALDSPRRERLRAQVDWVEAYERAEGPSADAVRQVVHRNCGQGGG